MTPIKPNTPAKFGISVHSTQLPAVPVCVRTKTRVPAADDGGEGQGGRDGEGGPADGATLDRP